MDIALPPMNPEVARLRRKAAQRKYVRQLRYVRFLWGMAGALLLLLVVEVLLVLTLSPRFWIHRIEAGGGETLAPAEIIRLAEVPPRSNFYRLSLGRVAHRIAAREPRVAQATVTRSRLGVLAITVQERRPRCQLGFSQPPRYLDEHGIAFTRPSAPIPPVPVVEGLPPAAQRPAFGTRADAPTVRAVIACLQAVEHQFDAMRPLEVARITLGETGRMTLVLRQGTRILLGKPEHFEEKLHVARGIIVDASANGYALDQIDYIDARAQRRAIGLGGEYKLRSGQEEPTP